MAAGVNKSIDIIEGKAERGQFLPALFRRFALQLVNNLIKGMFVFGGGGALAEKVLPGVAAAQADHEIIGGQAEGAQGVDEQGQQFGVGGGTRFADEVGVELKVFAQAALLLAFVTEKLGDGEPLDRLLVMALVGGDHAGQGGRHFRAERDRAFALVQKIIKLADDFLAAFQGV